jgi:type I restriction enzyme, R subunit
MDSYRVEKKAAMKIASRTRILRSNPRPSPAVATRRNRSWSGSAISQDFGTLFNDGDRVAMRIRDEIAPKVPADTA